MSVEAARLDLTQPKEAHVDERLRSNIIIWLTSVRPNGRPHSVPVWFLWDGATVLVFSKPDQKIRNLRANPAVLVALDNTADGEDVVVLEGEATLLESGSVDASMPTYLAKYGALLQEMGWTTEKMVQEYHQPILITPTRFLYI